MTETEIKKIRQQILAKGWQVMGWMSQYSPDGVEYYTFNIQRGKEQKDIDIDQIEELGYEY